MVSGAEREKLIQQFAERAEALGAKVERFPDFEAGRKFIGKFLHDRQIQGVLVAGTLQEKFRTADRLGGMDFENRRDFDSAEVGVMTADFGIAETGTLVQLLANDTEKLAGILPPCCLAILETGKIFPVAEDLAETLTGHLAQCSGFGPQAAFISGPSRTADIECQLQVGVHGPGELLILLIDRELP